VLALERGIIPPNTNFERLNPQIDAEFFNLEFPSQCIPWPKASSDQIRRASVNSFGFGGSNSHAVLEAAHGYLHVLGHRVPCFLSLYKGQLASLNYPQFGGTRFYPGTQLANGHAESPTTNGHLNGCTQSTSRSQPGPRLLILSAADEDGIVRQVRNFSQVLDNFQYDGNDIDVADDIVFTLNLRRTMLEWKSYAILGAPSESTDLEDLFSKPFRQSKTAAHLGLVFTGQGAQWPRMGVELLDWPIFAASLERSQKCLKTLNCDWSLVGKPKFLLRFNVQGSSRKS
jgi:acyl transferase domain-containing protein